MKSEEETPSDKESHDPLLGNNNMEEIAARDAERKRQRKQYIVPVIIAQLVGLLAIILVIIWIVKYLNGFNLSEQIFNLHPLLMIISLIYLFGNSILVYRIFWQNDKYKIKLAHSIMNMIAFIFAVVGVYAAFEFHNLKGIPNLYSLHSWIGFITVCLFGIQLVGGVCAFLFPLLTNNMKKFMLPYHVFFGLAIFIGSIVSAISGITEKAFFTMGEEYKVLPPAAYLVNFLGLTVIVFAGIVMFLATRESFRRPAQPEETQLYRHDETQFH